MRVLIIGGTIFLGRALADAALARGHQVTLFNRGQHNAELFPEVEKLRGDRCGDTSALAGRSWDAVIDTCGYFPRAVRTIAEALGDRVGHYTFISSISVYADFATPGIREEHPVGTIEDETLEEVTGESYGPLKALCEQAAEAAYPGRALNTRPGLIVGPNDPSHRFTYWPVRVARGGEVLAPEGPQVPVQIIDVRDLAEWTVRMIEQGKAGLYSATGPQEPVPLGTVLETCRHVSGSDAAFTWVSRDFLAENEVAPYTQMPIWVPDDAEHAGFSRIDVSKAVADGLSFRPLAETVRDTLAWDLARPADAPRRAGLSPEREAELLALWHAVRP